MIQEGIYATLAADSGVSAIVAARIYPLMIPQTSYTETTKFPCIVYSIDSKSRQVRFDGTDTLVSASLSVECYATTYSQAQSLAAAVRSVLVDFSGVMTGGGSPQSQTPVQSIFVESEDDTLAAEPGVYIVMQDYTVWYDEA
jgi:hypothetical protein